MNDLEKNPWKTLRSKVVYQNPWICVREDDVIRPDGKPGIYGVVEAKVATGVVALTPENEVYLVGQYRYPVNCYSWEIIEGGGERDEHPMAAAKRELQEEAGLVASSWEQLGGEIHLSNCFTAEQGFIFLAQGLSEAPCRPDGTEVLQIRKVPLMEALAMVDSGEITDSMSIIGLLRLARLLENAGR